MIKTKLKPIWKIIFFILSVVILLLLYSIFLGTRGLKIKEYKIINNNLPNSFYGLKIVQFSDLYYDKSINEEELINIVKNINLTKPDIVIFSGDLMDKDTIYTEDIENIIVNNLSNINSKYGKYYVSGDNDEYKNSFDLLMENSDFVSINNKCDNIVNNKNESILLCGLNTNNNDFSFLNDIEDFSYKIITMHYPDYYNKIKDYNFNLILSSHSYNGQISLPYIGGLILKSNAKKYNKEYYNVNNSDFYISGGLGTDNFNIRLLNKPSFNLYRLVDK